MTASPTDDLASAERRIQELTKQLSEAREQQAATAEILAATSSSPTDLRHVFAVVAASAAHLCEANDAQIRRVDGSTLRLVAQHGSIPHNPVVTVTRGFVSGRAVRERRTVQIADMHAVSDQYPEGSDHARRLGYRTLLVVPLIRGGAAIGVINIRRTEARPFSDRQIALLETFANQAVIAIENTRLFEAEQTRSRQLTERTQELTETLEYQIATSGVLETISRSPTDVQPVFDMIAQSAARLCRTRFCRVYRFDGHYIHLVAAHGLSLQGTEALRARGPSLPGRGFTAARSIFTNAIQEIPDVLADPDYDQSEIAIAEGFRSAVAVPMRKDGKPIGSRGGAFLQSSDRTSENLRRTSRHRHREYPVVRSGTGEQARANRKPGT